MLDIHTHILPGMDDGSPSSEISLMMLNQLKAQGVTAVCLTSHFYADENSPEQFLKRRDNCYEHLLQKVGERNMRMPLPVLLGAEVLYFNGINRSIEAIKPLCYQGSNILLLEMPFNKWTDRMVDEVIQIQRFSGLKIILAHIERYWPFVSEEILDEFRCEGIRMHLNCSALLNRRTRKKALNTIAEGGVQFLASDAHNMTTRPPRFDEAFAVLKKRGMEKAIEDLKARRL